MTNNSLDLYAEYERAKLMLALDRPIDAARDLAAVVEAEPTNRAALELYARALYNSAQLGRAESVLTRLVDLCPSDAWAHRVLARTLDRQNRPDDARPHHRLADALGAD